jgi:hypothetical protein
MFGRRPFASSGIDRLASGIISKPRCIAQHPICFKFSQRPTSSHLRDSIDCLRDVVQNVRDLARYLKYTNGQYFDLMPQHRIKSAARREIDRNLQLILQKLLDAHQADGVGFAITVAIDKQIEICSVAPSRTVEPKTQSAVAPIAWIATARRRNSASASAFVMKRFPPRG